ncbi:hypothetical protein K503DRAFT_773155 [Rhizopogon vinicolor AM-OR11-026]|uniref:Uncharacterized protein n=1 Tax=Rhizopogon vinicolor AM-OR11-026 TaxID=1314800 RepID=A0A1B7MT03_9AGAM|nr:hypothetical protein K503DRAFT_773155 [Rhizopogon vinicolor AM-OR11-026]
MKSSYNKEGTCPITEQKMAIVSSFSGMVSCKTSIEQARNKSNHPDYQVHEPVRNCMQRLISRSL